MVKEGSPLSKQMATAGLRNLTASNVGEVAKDMVSLGAIRPLLAVFETGTEQAQEHAAGVTITLTLALTLALTLTPTPTGR